MDEFDYSVQISDLDWDCFLHECEECDLLPAALASSDGSVVSDIDDIDSTTLEEDIHSNFAFDGPPDSEGSVAECYFSVGNPKGPEDVLSGSEEDTLEVVNRFFERLKSLASEEEPTGSSSNRKATGTGQRVVGLVENYSVICSKPEHTSQFPTEQCVNQSTGGKLTTNLENLSSKESTEGYLLPCFIPKEAADSETEVECSGNTGSPVKPGVREECPECCKIQRCDSKPRMRSTNGRENRAEKTLLKAPLSLLCDRHTDSENNPRVNNINDIFTTTDTLSIKSPTMDKDSRLITLDASKLQLKKSAAEPVRSTSKVEVNLHTETFEEVKKTNLRGILSKGVMTKTGNETCSCSPNHNSWSSNTEMSPTYQKVLSQFNVCADSSTTDIHGKESSACNKIIFPVLQNDEKHDKVDQDIKLENSSRSSLCNQGLRLDNLPTEFTPAQNEGSATETEENSKRATSERFEFCLFPDNKNSNKMRSLLEKDGETQKVDRAQNLPPTTVENGKVPGDYKNQDKSESGFPSEITHFTEGWLPLPVTESKLFNHSMQNNLQQSNICFSEGFSEDASLTDSIACPDSEESISILLADKTITFNHSKSLGVKMSKDTQEVAVSSKSECLETSMLGAETVKVNVSAFKQTEPVEFTNACEKLDFRMESYTSDVQTDIPEQKCVTFSNEELGKRYLLKNLQKSIMVESENRTSPMTIDETDLIKQEAENNTITDVLGNPPKSQSKHEFEEETLNVPVMDCFTDSDSPESINENSGPGGLLSVESNSDMNAHEDITLIHGAKLNPDDNKHNQICPDQNQFLVSGTELSTDSSKHNQTCDDQDRDIIPASELNIDRNLEKNTFLHTEGVPEHKGHKEELGDVPEPTRPVYAISCFWDEMEKLTINDILQLRLVGNAQSPSLPSYLQDDNMMHASGAANSGFFTHLEDSKPNLSSGDISTFSDFEEEFSLTHTLSETANPEPQVSESQFQSSPNPNRSRDVLWESGIDPMLALNDGLVAHSDDVCDQSMFLGSDQKCLTRMRKNISVKNLTGLEIGECHMGLGSQAASLKAIMMEEKDSVYALTESAIPVSIENIPTIVSSFSRKIKENNTVSFPEMFEYFFVEDETEARLVDKTSSDSFINYGDSVPETYDYFFSEFEAGNFFLPLIQSSGDRDDKPVTIFSPSRSAKRRLQFSKEYDFFFPEESPVASDDDEDVEFTQVRVVTRSDSMATKSESMGAQPDMYEDFFTDSNGSEDLFWKNLFSLRRVRLPGLREPKENVVICKEKSQPENSRRQGRTHTPPHIYQLETWVFRMMEDLQGRHANLQTALIDPRRDIPLLSLKQSDMCLICIAFASWVLRSANPQAGDTWKAAILANISALSAIRYLRRYIREEASRKKLRREYLLPKPVQHSLCRFPLLQPKYGL